MTVVFGPTHAECSDVRIGRAPLGQEHVAKVESVAVGDQPRSNNLGVGTRGGIRWGRREPDGSARDSGQRERSTCIGDSGPAIHPPQRWGAEVVLELGRYHDTGHWLPRAQINDSPGHGDGASEIHIDALPVLAFGKLERLLDHLRASDNSDVVATRRELANLEVTCGPKEAFVARVPRLRFDELHDNVVRHRSIAMNRAFDRSGWLDLQCDVVPDGDVFAERLPSAAAIRADDVLLASGEPDQGEGAVGPGEDGFLDVNRPGLSGGS